MTLVQQASITAVYASADNTLATQTSPSYICSKSGRLLVFSAVHDEGFSRVWEPGFPLHLQSYVPLMDMSHASSALSSRFPVMIC